MANKLAKLTTKTESGSDYPSPAYEGKYKPSKEEEMRRRRYKAEDGLRTLQRAQEVMADKQLMADIRCVAAEQMKALKKVHQPSGRKAAV